MGQYYVIANLDKKEFIKPHDFGDGAKLMEFGLGSTGVMSGLAILLASSNGLGGGDLWIPEDAEGERPAPWGWVPGHWAGDRIVVAGDYDDDPESPGFHVYREAYREITPMEDLSNKVTGEDKTWTNISKDVIGALAEDHYARPAIIEVLKGSWKWSESARETWAYIRKPDEPETLGQE
jgi:hypothetical protein